MADAGGEIVMLAAPGVELHRLAAPLGDRLAVLKHRATGRYFALSPLGLDIWQRIASGEPLPGLVEAVTAGQPAAARVRALRLCAQLRAQGFARLAGEAPPAPSPRLHLDFHHPLLWEIRVRGCVPLFQILYLLGGKWLVSPMATGLAAIVGVAGILLLAGAPALVPQDVRVLPWLFAATIAATFVHECLHGLAVVRFGRAVDAVGIGWFWFGPAPFVDTSDMWLGTRAQRIWVSAAGPAGNVALGGAAALLANIPPAGSGLAQMLWAYSAVCYFVAAYNLCPLLEFDGYFILTDVTGVPNLRRKAYAWLGRRLRGVPEPAARPREGRLFLPYCVGSLAYVAVFGTLTVEAVASFAEAHVRFWLPAAAPVVASATALGFAGLLLFGTLKDVFVDVRRGMSLSIASAR